MASSGKIGYGNYFRGGMRQGPWNLCDGNNNKAKGSYINNMRDGSWIQWHPNGQKKIEGIFHNDMENGPSTQWAPDGRKIWEGSYRNGQYHGKWRVWNEVGELSEFEYMNGVRIR